MILRRCCDPRFLHGTKAGWIARHQAVVFYPATARGKLTLKDLQRLEIPTYFPSKLLLAETLDKLFLDWKEPPLLEDEEDARRTPLDVSGGFRLCMQRPGEVVVHFPESWLVFARIVEFGMGLLAGPGPRLL